MVNRCSYTTSKGSTHFNKTWLTWVEIWQGLKDRTRTDESKLRQCVGKIFSAVLVSPVFRIFRSFYIQKFFLKIFWVFKTQKFFKIFSKTKVHKPLSKNNESSLQPWIREPRKALSRMCFYLKKINNGNLEKTRFISNLISKKLTSTEVTQ